MPSEAKAYAAFAADKPFAPFSFDRRDPGPRDVAMDILHCGVCHSDLHTARAEWDGTIFPCVPGHEIVGRVAAVGSEVTDFAIGDLAGVGCMVDSCRTCASCQAGEEQYCEGTGFVGTYNAPDKHLGGHTLGGYSDHIVVDTDFVLKIGHDDRLQRLQARLNRDQAAFNAATLGKTCQVLIERKGKLPGQMLGKSPWLQSVHLMTDAAIGDLVEVEIVRADPNSLAGVEQVKAAA